MALKAQGLTAIRLAPGEREGMAAALAKAGLPSEDIAASDGLFWRFEQDAVPIGFGGLEIRGADALLRSVMTLPPARARGLGGAIVAAIEAEAGLRRCRAIYLLTTSGAAFFERLGYAACDRADVPPAVRASQQFAVLCPASAAVMVKRLS